MYPNAGASQRAQDHSLGLGGRGILIGGESLQPPWPAHQPAAGGRRLAATRMEISWEPRLDYIYYVACLSRAGAGGELGWLPPVHTMAALLTAAAPSSASAAQLVFHSRCKRGLPRRFNYERSSARSARGCGFWLVH